MKPSPVYQVRQGQFYKGEMHADHGFQHFDHAVNSGEKAHISLTRKLPTNFRFEAISPTNP